MAGMNKRSTDPKTKQEKLNVNPLYNTSALLKAAADRFKQVTDMASGKKKKEIKK